MIYFAVVIVIFLSFILTAITRRYAERQRIVDIPNARSSHTIATPRGGGVAIVLSFLCVSPFLGFVQVMEWTSIFGLLGASVIVAGVGALDDHGHVAARWRLLAHFLAAIWALVWLGGVPDVQLAGLSVSLGWLGPVLAAGYLVWLLNLYNFMDGIDGIASIQAITTCLSACLLYAGIGEQAMIWAPLLLAAAVSGFLYWNFPPAKIFMGDAGSGFIGIALGVLSLQAAWVAFPLFWAWLVLLGVFIVDSTFTLVRRLLRGEKLYEAHRSHAYQFASRRHGQHRVVTLAVLAINVLWLLPVAMAIVFLGLDGLLGVGIAYAPLLALAVFYRAGTRES